MKLHLTFLLFISLLSTAYTQNKEVLKALQELDAEFDSCFAWWAKIYDPKSGGFFYSLSAKNSNGKYAPWFESAAKGINVMQWSGLLESAPQAYKSKAIKYFQSLQEKETGFFRDSFYGRQYTENRLNRALGMCTGSLAKLNAKALYKLPHENIENNQEAQKHYAHLKSEEALLKWLKALTWNSRVWTAGARTLTLSKSLSFLPEDEKKKLLPVVEKFVSAQQTKDGFLGTVKDGWYSRLSGTYKAFSFFEKNGLTIPNVEQLKKTVLKHFKKQKYSSLIVLYNTVNILSIIERQTNNFTIEEKVWIIKQTKKILSGFHAKDGGFLTNKGKPSPNAKDIILAKRVLEGNTNSTGLAHKIRDILYTMVSGKSSPHPHPKGHIYIEGLKSYFNN